MSLFGILNRSNNPDKELELLEHLAELRTRLLRSMFFIAIGMGVAWFFFDDLYSFLLAPAITILKENDTRFLQSTFMQGFTLRIQVALIGGIILACPFWTTEFWLFVSPAFTKQERKALYFIIPLSVLLFVSGVTLCYIAMPRALEWFVTLVPPDTQLLPDISRTLVFIVQMYLAFGVMFEMPVGLMFLAKVGVVNSRMMWKLWREATIGIAFLAALITPSNDAFTMLMMAVPMVVLYFLSITLVKWVERGRPKEQAT